MIKDIIAKLEKIKRMRLLTKTIDDKKLKEAFDDVFRYSLIMGVKFPWQMIAATLVTIGLRIYRTVLDDEGYKGMTDKIADNFENIEKFKDETLH